MFRNLVVNTVISASAFFASAIVPLLLVPLLVGHYGIVQYGLIVLARILLPTGTFAIFDFGNSEIATQNVSRARHDGDWTRTGRRLVGLAAITLTVGLLVSIAMGLSASLVAELFNVPIAAQGGFIRIIVATSIAFSILLVGLIIEGILKGFEAFKILRTVDVAAAVLYGLIAAAAVLTGAGYEWVALALLATQTLRVLFLAIGAVRLLHATKIRLRKPQSEDWQDLKIRCRGLIGNRLLSAAQSQATPLIISALLTPAAVGVYDLIVRLPRFLKVVTGLMNAAVLPVSTRLDAAGDTAGMRQLGEFGLLGVTVVAAPICAWGAAFSEPILRIWVGDSYAVHWPWQALMFAIPVCNAITSFGGGALLGRPHVVDKLNVIALVQIIVQFGLGVGLVHVFGERAFILGQVVAVVASLPFQLRIVQLEKHIPFAALGRHIVLVGSFLLLALAATAGGVASWSKPFTVLAVSLPIWLIVSYWGIWNLLIRPEERRAILGLLNPTRRTSSTAP